MLFALMYSTAGLDVAAACGAAFAVTLVATTVPLCVRGAPSGDGCEPDA